MLCAFCGKDIIKKLPYHLMNVHGKSLKENTIKIMGLDPNNLPKCPFCGMDVMIDRFVHDTCEMPACIEHQKAINRHNGQVIENQRRVREGTSNLLKQNLQYDDQGRSLIHLKSYRSRMINGNLYPKTSLLERRIYDYVKTRFPNAVSQYGIPQSPYNHPYDIFIPDLKLLIEIDGNYWHITEEDRKWDEAAKQYGFTVERISWDENQKISDAELARLVDSVVDKYIAKQNFSNRRKYFPASKPSGMVQEELTTWR